MPRPPNYKQEKKRREDEQRRRRNAEAEQRKAARKPAPEPLAVQGERAKPEVP